MRVSRSWLTPLLLVAAQLVVWPGAALLAGHRPDRVSVAAGLVATAFVAVALGWRHRAPVTVLAIVSTVAKLGYLATSPEALVGLAIAEMVALYTVAARRSARVALVATAAVVVMEAALTAGLYDTGRGYVGGLLFSLTLYLLAVGLGRGRRRWYAARADAAELLAWAEAEQRRAAGLERERLARELHDVSAHHLTSIVVTVTAAERLADRRPELAAKALEFSARTARETLAALHRLVAVMRTTDEAGPGGLDERLGELADGFRRLGQPVTLEADPVDVGPAVGEAAYGIAREALTNTLRHAPGGAVRVCLTLADDALVLVVDDEGGTMRPSAGGLGSGRGIIGMRERAATLGGTCEAGARGDGWRVRAVLPFDGAAAGTPPPGAGSAPAGWWRGPRAMDGVVALATVVPLAGGLLAGWEGPPVLAPATTVLLALLMVLHAVPLLWRRDRPWLVLLAVVGSAVLWPAAALYARLPGDAVWLLVATVGAELAAVYSVAAYGRPRWATCLAVPAAAAGFGTALVATAATDGRLGGAPATLAAAATMAATLAMLLVPVLGAAWTAGFTVRVRRDRTVAQERDAVAEVTARAVAASRAERARISAGLRAAVLEHAQGVLAAAEGNRLDEVAAEARASLAAMRELLRSLRTAPPQPGQQPTDS
ncbi:histidine kinase [Polymorphospora sp. NPDC050346]|uniref:ATP-binding protein n=1 Tax=Polymorphospora sp. NPDC050346 TaxID=3155780 RepID=UPI0033D4535D